MGIRKLARELNLSIGTVSRALNGRPDVSDTTRARVQAAAALAGYVPNQSGRSLRKGSTGIVAAVIPTSGFVPSSEATFFRVLEGVRRTLLHDGFDLVVLLRGPDEDPLDHLQRIVSRRIADGVIITQTRAQDPRIAYLRDAGVEFVAFGRSGGHEGYAWVDFDFEGAATEAVRLFADAGHRRIALVTNEHDLNYNDLLRCVFRAEAARHGIGPEAALLLVAPDSRLGAAARAALADPDRAPSALLAGNETIAAGLSVDLAALGRPVGVEVALISVLPAHNPQCHAPPLTSFDADLDAVGCALAERLLRVLPGASGAAPRPGLIPLRLAARASHVARRCVTA